MKAFAFVVVLVALAAAGCSSGKEAAGTTNPATAAPVPTGSSGSGNVAVPGQLAMTFLRTCSSSGSAKQFDICRCALLKLEKTATLREISVLAVAGRTPPLATQRKYKAALKACA